MRRSIEDITVDIYEANTHLEAVKSLIDGLEKEKAQYMSRVYKREIVDHHRMSDQVEFRKNTPSWPRSTSRTLKPMV
jgi:hypothetical protein